MPFLLAFVIVVGGTYLLGWYFDVYAYEGLTLIMAFPFGPIIWLPLGCYLEEKINGK